MHQRSIVDKLKNYYLQNGGKFTISSPGFLGSLGAPNIALPLALEDCLVL